MTILFYDFEVFRFDWLVVVCNPFAEKKWIPIWNNQDGLEQFYEEHKKDVWVGYNSRNYDTYILKAILLGFDPYQVSKFIIEKKQKGWQYSELFKTIPLYNYDCMSKFHSLKQLEGFMGNDMRETTIPFSINRKLTDDEMYETMKYCKHDVEQTMEIFMRNKADFDAHVNLLRTFKLPLSNISRTQAQLSALALGCQKQDHFDAWDIQLVDTLRIEKYKDVIDWFLDPMNQRDDMCLTMDVCGVPHQFGLGGLHGAPIKPIHAKGLILHVDVTSFYPSIMIRYDMLSRNVKDRQVFKDIYDLRVALKKAGKKKEQAPYKIILNSTFGICNDPTSAAYDPRQAKNVCINGQLLLLDLLEHLEGHCEVIQSNTDGLIIKIPDTDEAFDKVDDICFEWEQRTGMGLGFDVITEIWQKDVNNYIIRFEDGKLERKGKYVKPLNDLDNDLPIINTALVDCMTRNIPVEQTIMQCDDLKQFQKIVRISGKYMCGWHNGKQLSDQTFRVFASNDWSDSYIGKMKNANSTIEKFADTPDHCFIYNDDVNGKKVPNNLDRDYYIDLAKKRLKQFGI